MKSAGKARNNGLYRHIRTSKEIIRNLLNDSIKNKRYRIKEDKVMTKTMKIEGMMCGHCEARVKKSLEALDQVQEAVVSHETGTAVVTLKADVDDSVLKKTVEDQDYKVTSIQ